MYYNIAVKGGSIVETQYIKAVSIEEVEKLEKAYHSGKDFVTVGGKKFFLKNPRLIKIYDTSKRKGDSTSSLKKAINIEVNFVRRGKMGTSVFAEFGEDVTGDFIKGEWGDGSKDGIAVANGEYINSKRLEEIKSLDNKQFDLTKLIRLCEEANDSFSRGNYFSTGSIVRSIIDHVPPIFSCKNFDEVANNYKSKGRSQSFSDSMKQLNGSMKKISHKLLHSQITDRESLPNETQVDCRRDLDVLLEEVVRVLK